MAIVDLATNLIKIQTNLKSASDAESRQSDLVAAKQEDLADAQARLDTLRGTVGLLQQAYTQAEADLRAWAREEPNESV